MRPVEIGAIWNDIGDAVDTVTRPISKAVSDVFDAIPGSEWVKGIVNGPLRDFANSAVGKVVLRAMATSLTGGLAGTLGPQLATVAWSLPGLVRGESFDEAWWKEFSWRVEKTAETLGTDAAGKALGDMLKVASDRLMDQAKKAFPTLPVEEGLRRFVNETGLTPEALARELGIRPDVAAAALNLVLREMRFPLGNYAIATGDPSLAMPSVPLRTISSFSTGPRVTHDYTGVTPPLVDCPAWHQARAGGQAPVILNAIKAKCEATLMGVRSTSFKASSALPRVSPTPTVQAYEPPTYAKAPLETAEFPGSSNLPGVPSSPQAPATEGALPSRALLIVGAGLLALALFVDFGKLQRGR